MSKNKLHPSARTETLREWLTVHIVQHYGEGANINARIAELADALELKPAQLLGSKPILNAEHADASAQSLVIFLDIPPRARAEAIELIKDAWSGKAVNASPAKQQYRAVAPRTPSIIRHTPPVAFAHVQAKAKVKERHKNLRFSNLFTDWVRCSDSVNTFLESTALKGVLSEEDVTALMKEDKAPNCQFTNFVCAMVPERVTSRWIMREQGYKAVEKGDKPQVEFGEAQFHTARLAMLQRIAAGEVTNNVVDKKMSVFRRALRFLRHTMGIRTKELAREIEFSSTGISHYENEHQMIPEPPVFDKFCTAFKLDEHERALMDRLYLAEKEQITTLPRYSYSAGARRDDTPSR